VCGVVCVSYMCLYCIFGLQKKCYYSSESSLSLSLSLTHNTLSPSHTHHTHAHHTQHIPASVCDMYNAYFFKFGKVQRVHPVFDVHTLLCAVRVLQIQQHQYREKLRKYKWTHRHDERAHNGTNDGSNNSTINSTTNSTINSTTNSTINSTNYPQNPLHIEEKKCARYRKGVTHTHTHTHTQSYSLLISFFSFTHHTQP